MKRTKLLTLILAITATCTMTANTTAFAKTIDTSNTEKVTLDSSSVFPNVEGQNLTFDKSNPTDLVIKNVNFNNQTLHSFAISGKYLKLNDIVCDQDKITIPAKLISDLNLTPGTYSTAIEFSDSTLLSGYVNIDVIDSGSSVTPPDNNGTVTPPGDNGTITPPDNNEDTVVQNPSVKEQVLEYNLSTPKDLTISNVNFDGTTLRYIIINGNTIPASELTVTDSTIVIPSNVLYNLNILQGNYDISFKFSNGSTLTGLVDLKVTSDSAIVPPSTDDTIDFDINTSKHLEIPNFIPAGRTVNSITINNKEVKVINNTVKTASNASDSLPVVYIVNDKLVIPTETLKYIGIDNSTSTYNIDAELDNGEKISKTVNVIDSSNNDNNNNNNNDSNDNNTNDNNTNDNNINDNTNTNNSNGNNTTSPESNSSNSEVNNNKVNTESTLNSTLPKTGSESVMPLIGLLTSASGVFLLRKRKNKR